MLAVVALASARHRSRLLREDLAGGVEQVEGEVTFTRRGYEARLDPRPRPGSPIVGPLERPLPSRPVELPPGRYRFFFLPQSRTLLSAEPLTPVATGAAFPPAADPLLGLPGYRPAPAPYLAEAGAAFSTPPQGALGALQYALATGNRFTPEELALNRAGRLSGRQARRLVSLLMLVVPFWGLATAIGIGILLANVSAGAFGWFAWTTGAVFVIGELLVLSFGLRRLADALRREVRSVAGVVTREADSSGDGTIFRYKVNKSSSAQSPSS